MKAIKKESDLPNPEITGNPELPDPLAPSPQKPSTSVKKEKIVEVPKKKRQRKSGKGQRSKRNKTEKSGENSSKITEKGGKGSSTESLLAVETDFPGIKRLVQKPFFNCRLCLAAFMKPVEMEHHLKFNHTREVEQEMKKLGVDHVGDGKDSVCRYCSKMFYDKNNLVRHSLEVHTMFRSHICQLCPGRRGFHKPEFGHDHVKRYHSFEMANSNLTPTEFIEDTIRYVPRPYAMNIAVTPVPRHLYYVT